MFFEETAEQFLNNLASGESYSSDLGPSVFSFLPWNPRGPVPAERSEALILTGGGSPPSGFFFFGGPLTPGDSLFILFG